MVKTGMKSAEIRYDDSPAVRVRSHLGMDRVPRYHVIVEAQGFSGHAEGFYASFTTLAVVCAGWSIVRVQRGRRPIQRPVAENS